MLKNIDMDYAQKMQRCHEYVEALEEERKKIQVFQRELPLCLELVTQAIEACRRELSGTTSEYVRGQSECSEQTTSECGGPVFEEFIPIKRGSSCDEDDEHESHEPENIRAEKNSENIVNNSETFDKKKSDWLRSAQLWNQSPDLQPKEDLGVAKKAAVVEVKGNGGAFQPFHKEKPILKSNHQQQQQQPVKATVGSAPSASSTRVETAGGKGESDKDDRQLSEQQQQRKQRRCWSPELHRRFLHALQQLGGSHVATPKQIRELMKVDGLTNDEVKSHLQKYRLHTRRPTPPAAHNGGNAQQPQFVVVGGIWMPPATDYVPPADGANGVYAPVPAPPVLPPTAAHSAPSSKHSEERSSGRCNSPATSSSTHTTTTSPVA